MKAGFEEKFTEIQSGLISLCLEGAESEAKNIDNVYGYGYIGEDSYMFNVFFRYENVITPSHKVIKNRNLLLQVLDYGIKDLIKLNQTCDEYEAECPREMKMYYDNRTGKFKAEYKYKNNVPEDYSPEESFMSWRSEMSSQK